MLSNSQERIERSLYEAIRLVLIGEGYLPDISDIIKYPPPYDVVDQSMWNTEIDAIVQAKGFAIELFSNGAQESKGIKRVPRIVIITRRSMPGDIGAPMDGVIINDPNIVGGLARQPLPLRTTTFHIDIHLVTNSAKQDRVLGAVLAKALGMMRYLPYYDDITEQFLITQYNYYDLPDVTEGIVEKVYSYEIPDIHEISYEAHAVVKINQITVEQKLMNIGATIDEETMTVEGGHVADNDIIIPQP